MVNITQINDIIANLEKELTPQSVECTFIHNEKMDVLYWYKNSGQLRTDEEVRNKIKRFKEECFLLSNNDIVYKAKQEKIKILYSLLD